jgi:membrane associated rhomboid family serine protease
MGIYDREYYRREGPSFLGTISERGKVCKALILINLVCFVVQLLTAGRGPENTTFGWFTDLFELNADSVLHGQVWRLLTYAFLHDPNSLLHIVFNMLFLWWFGTELEDHYGPREFLGIYLISALTGGLAFFAAHFAEMEGLRCIGASGAVTGIMVLYAFHYPTRLILLFFLIPVPVWLLVILNVGWDAWTFLHQPVGMRTTAVTVHLGGALFAFVYYKRHWRLLSIWSSLRSWQQQLFRPRLRVYREEHHREPVHVAAPPHSADVDEQLEAKLDEILQKVARSGQDSLSDSERQILMRASEIYKRRRT